MLLYSEPAAEAGSLLPRSISAKFRAEYDDVVDAAPLLWPVLLAPKLPVLLCALSSLLPPLADFADKPPPGICSGGSLLLPRAFSSGVCAVPIGVARLSLGGPCRPGICKGGMGDIPLGFWFIGGAAALLTGLWFGEAGIARPSRGTLGEAVRLPPGIGGLRSGAGDAISVRSGGSRVRWWVATIGKGESEAVEEVRTTSHDALLKTFWSGVCWSLASRGELAARSCRYT